MSRDLNDLDDRLRPIVDQLISNCAQAGVMLTVITTLRTMSEQEQAVRAGVSWTMNSKHLPQPPDDKSLAVDLVPTDYIAMKGWNPAGPKWWIIAQNAVALGLRSGMDWEGVGLPPVGTTRHAWDPGHCEYKL